MTSLLRNQFTNIYGIQINTVLTTKIMIAN